MKINSDRIIARLQINNILEKDGIDSVYSLKVLAHKAKLKYCRSKMNIASMHNNWVEYNYWDNKIRKNYDELNNLYTKLNNKLEDNRISIENNE